MNQEQAFHPKEQYPMESGPESVPPFAEKILYHALPARLREEAMGDLEEEYHLRIMSMWDPSKTRWWYRIQVAKSVAVFIHEQKGGFMSFFWSIVFFIFIILVGIGIDFSTMSLQPQVLAWFIDIPSFFFVFPPAIVFARAITAKGSFKLSWKLVWSDQAQVDSKEIEEAYRFLQISGNVCFLIGCLGTLAGWIIIAHALDDLSKFGPAFAISIITFFYGLFFKICFYAAEQKIRNNYLED